MAQRDDFPELVKRALAARVGNLCSNPACRALTSGPHEEAAKAVNLGVAAHITAAAPGGPRYDAALTVEQRASAENAIWLCQNCAKLIDSDLARFPVELLRKWKAQAEEEARVRVGKTGLPMRMSGATYNVTIERAIIGALAVGDGAVANAGVNGSVDQAASLPATQPRLPREKGVVVVDPAPGVAAYRAMVKSLSGSMSIPGTSLGGATEDVFLWPRLRVWGRDRRIVRLDDEFLEEVGEAVDPLALPEGAGARTVIVAGAGAGKSALLQALAHRYAESMWLPIIIPLADLARRANSILGYLDTVVGIEACVSIDWTELCESGAVLLLLDGLDELPPHERARVLQALNTFSARFQRVAWILTARETAALAVPVGARVLELQPLRSEDVEPFCARWMRPEQRERARHVSNIVARNRELRRMARVPLLLSLMAEHAVAQEAPLPTRRSDLLERYLKTLLRPAAHKPALVALDALVLRTGAERLAFAALEAGGTELAARQARRVLDSASEALACLVACGVVREHGDAYQFVFPLIQEYLAGCYIEENLRAEIEARFARQTSRPWAQALLFALERCENADPFVTRILDLPDDAFGTTLKAIARSIANGARVAASTRSRVGAELAQRWEAEGRTSRIGELIADGYTDPLPEAARARIARGDGLDEGGGEILAAAEDDELTEAALRAILAQGFPGHVLSWQTAINRTAARAAQIYLDRAKRPQTNYPEREVHWLAYLLAELRAVSDPKDPRVRAAVDEEVHPLLRIASQTRLVTPLKADAELLVADAFRSYWRYETPAPSPVLELLCGAIWRLPDSVGAWRRMLHRIESAELHATGQEWWLFDLTPQEAYWRPLLWSITTRIPPDAALRHLAEFQRQHPVAATRLDFLQLTRASLGDADAFAALARRLPDLRRSDIALWLMLTTKHAADIAMDGIGQLQGARMSDRAEIRTTLSFALRHEVELLGFSGSARGRARRLHAAAGTAVRVLSRWAEEALPRSGDRVAFLASALALGDRAVAPALLLEFEAQLSAPVLDFNLDRALAEALTSLAEARIPVSLDTLRLAALRSKHNLAYRAFDQIESIGTIRALDTLLDIHRQVSESHKEPVEAHVERMAHSLGVRVTRASSGELVRAVLPD